MAKVSPKITVGIPYHSGSDSKHLKTCIDSILEQSILPERIILIQNGHVEGELKSLALRTQSDKVKIDHLTVMKQGLPAALNASLKITTTEYYARMDSDDIAFPQRLEQQLRFMEQNPEISILGGWAKEFSSKSGLQASVEKRTPTDKKLIVEWFHYRNPLIHSTVMFRMSVFKKMGYYDEEYRTDQDLQLWGRAIKSSIGIANLREFLIYFRTDNMLKKRSAFDAIWRQVKARYSVRTYSPKLNVLKILALSFRLLPKKLRGLGYKHLR